MIKISNNKGFTLIEIIMVVSVIAILAAIAIPSFSAFRVRAWNSAAMSDLKNIKTLQESFFIEREIGRAHV